MSMITATVWVPRGHAATFPTKYNVDEDELARISKLAKLKLEDANEDLEHAKAGEEDGATSGDETENEDTGVKLTQSNGWVRRNALYPRRS